MKRTKDNVSKLTDTKSDAYYIEAFDNIVNKSKTESNKNKANEYRAFAKKYNICLYSEMLKELIKYARALEELLVQSPHTKILEVSDLMKDKASISINKSQLRALMYELGFSYRKNTSGKDLGYWHQIDKCDKEHLSIKDGDSNAKHTSQSLIAKQDANNHFDETHQEVDNYGNLSTWSFGLDNNYSPSVRLDTNRLFNTSLTQINQSSITDLQFRAAKIPTLLPDHNNIIYDKSITELLAKPLMSNALRASTLKANHFQDEVKFDL
jgi:hypothetical protein